MTNLSIPDQINPNQYKQDKMGVKLQAVDFWNSHKDFRFPNKKKITRKLVAQAHGIPAGRMTIILQNPSQIGSQVGSPLRIPLKEELQLVQWICQRCAAHLPTSMVDVLNKANQVVTIHNHFATKTRRGPLTKSWFYEFYKRHADQLSRRRVQGLDISRQEGRSTARLIEYYSCLRDMLFNNKFKQSKIYNLDETPCPIDNVPRYSLWHKSIKEAHVTQSDNRMVLTMMACVAANGTSIPPLVIFQGKTMDISYLTDQMEILTATNDNAYMTQELFNSWGKHFVELSKPSKEFPVLMIMDNFVGHLDPDTIELFSNKYVFLVGLAPHTSDLTQPLDLSVFSPFKKAYRKHYATLLSKKKITKLHQRDFTEIMAVAYKESFTPGNISSGFQRGGILPFVPLNVLTKCDDWNADIYNQYVPNEEFTETSWIEMKQDPQIINYRVFENSKDTQEVECDVQVDADQCYEQAINSVLTFHPPTQELEIKQAAPQRVPAFNVVMNRSNLTDVVRAKQKAQEEKDAKTAAAQERKAEREAKKEEEIKICNFLELSGLVRCKCKKKCTARCVCKQNNQMCINLCGCQCAEKNDSAKNQFNEAQRIK